uniref:Uncharacterized protein n=1 Tax=Anguilla anguilla TaxID=7936 RepID=A0A0E9W3P6_ANGAN
MESGLFPIHVSRWRKYSSPQLNRLVTKTFPAPLV